MSTKDHWNAIYRQKGLQEVSWYRPHLDRSLEFIRIAGLSPDAAILDVGGGNSTLVEPVREVHEDRG